MSAAEQLAPIAIVEHFAPGSPGTRHQWSYRICVLSASSTHVLHQESGEGPLGRMRALQRARDYCVERGMSALELMLEAERLNTEGARISRSMYWTRLVSRLRAQGVL